MVCSGDVLGSMLAYVGFSCWLMLALCWVKLAHVASSWLQVGVKMPKMGPKSLQEAPRASKMSQDGLKNAKNGSQDEVKIEIFEVYLRKRRKYIWSYYSNVFLLFGSWESINFDQFWEQNPMKFPSFWPSWVVYAPRSLTIGARWST